MKLNRKWLMVIALVMSLTMATAGTLAYLTDRDTEVNVFTMGNVDIELKEDFEQDSELIPGLDIEKEPTITNIGKNDAWVWATIAIPSALDEDDASANVVHFNMSKDSVAEGKWTWWAKDSNKSKWLKEYDVEYEGVKYNVFTVLYQTALKKGDTTEPVIYKVYMDDHVDIAPDGQLYHVEKGVVTELDWNINEDGNPKIYVSAYAMQTNEFADVYAAYEAYTAQWTSSGDAKDAIAWGEDDGETDSASTPFAMVTTLGTTDTLKNKDGDVTVLEQNRTIDTTNSSMGYDVGKIPLDVAYQFEPTMTYEEGQDSEYADWHADFVVSVNKDIPAYGIGLAGYYDAWCSFNNDKWVLLASPDPIAAGTEIRLVEAMGGGSITVSYEELCNYGNDGIGFLCGAVEMNGTGKTIDGQTPAARPAGTVLTVELRLYEATGGSASTETGEYITTGTYTYTFN